MKIGVEEDYYNNLNGRDLLTKQNTIGTMDKGTKLSVVIPVCNRPELLNNLLDALRKQTSDRFEVIVADDASEGTAIKDCVDSHGYKYVRLNRSGKAGGARNAGVANASGQYIWFVDADDMVIGDDAIEGLLAFIDEHGDPDEVAIGVRVVMNDRQFNFHVPQTFDEALSATAVSWNFVFKKDKYVKQPERTWHEDVVWYFAIHDKFDTFAHYDKDIYMYDKRHKEGTVTSTNEYVAERIMNLFANAVDNTLLKEGKDDMMISDYVRLMADMYDLRNKVQKPEVKLYVVESLANMWRNFCIGKYSLLGG